MPIISIGQGLLPILGFSYGAQRYDRALEVVRISAIAASVLAALSFIIAFSLPAPIIRIFSADSELVSAGAHGARLLFAAAYLVGFQIVGSVVFQAIGKAVPAFVTAISRNILFFLPAILILPRFLGLDGVWASFPVADSLSFVLTLILLLPQIRRFRRAALAGQGVEGALAPANPGTSGLGSDSNPANGES
jgi:Na+-driven multidrug efflux pump